MKRFKKVIHDAVNMEWWDHDAVRALEAFLQKWGERWPTEEDLENALSAIELDWQHRVHEGYMLRNGEDYGRVEFFIDNQVIIVRTLSQILAELSIETLSNPSGIKQGDKIRIKSTVTDDWRRLDFMDPTGMDRFINTEQTAQWIYIAAPDQFNGADEWFITIDLFCEIPLAACELVTLYTNNTSITESDRQVSDIMNFDLATMNDGQLIGLKRAYQEMANTRRAGRLLVNLSSEFSHYPAVTFDNCAELVTMEIDRRTRRNTDVVVSASTEENREGRV